VRTHVSAALARHGMEIPYPHQVQLKRRAPTKVETREEAAVGRLPILSRLELFASLTVDERKALASELVSCPYVGDDMISRQGEAAESLFVLAEGAVDIIREEGDTSTSPGQRTKLATLTAPAYFGEMGLLTGQARTATVMARGYVLCYRLDKLAFDAILRARPELADAMSKVLGARQAANDATLQAASAEARARQASSRSDEMLRRIRDWFGLSA
jgi:CRP-like cAMP-binding protein